MEKKINIQKRISNLTWMELLNAFWIPVACLIIARNAQKELGFLFWISAALNSFILLQGSAFWFWLSRHLADGDNAFIRGVFFKFRRINIILISSMIIIFILNSTFQIIPFSSNLEKYISFILMLLSVLEYINYFEVQLMYTSRSEWSGLLKYKKLKKAVAKRIVNKRH